MDLATRYCARSALLLRLLDDADLGDDVGPRAQAEIRRVLHLPDEVAVVDTSEFVPMN